VQASQPANGRIRGGGRPFVASASGMARNLSAGSELCRWAGEAGRRRMREKGGEPIRLLTLAGNGRVASALTETLARRGLAWQVEAGLHPGQLAERLRRSPPDLVLLDFTRSGRFGFESAWRMRQAWPEVRALGVSDEGRFWARLPWLRLGCHGALVTPAEPADLEAVVERVCREGFGLCSRAGALLGRAASEEPGCWAPGWKDLLKRLHALMVAGDPEASEVFAGLLREPLTAALVGRFKGTDGALIADAVTDALLEHLKRPSRFDPRRGDLEEYLRLAARRNLSNFLRAESRRKQREQRAAEAERLLRASTGSGENTDPEVLEGQALWQRREEALENFLAGLGPQGRAVIELCRQGERRTEVFARVLGIEHLPVTRQKARVYAAKSRFLRQARRRLCST